MVVNITKKSQKMKNKSLLSIEKKYRMRKKHIIKSNDLESTLETINLLQKTYLIKNFISI